MTATDLRREPDSGSPPPDVTIDAPPEATPLTLTEAQTSDVRADHVASSQSAIGRVVAHDVRSEQGAIGLVRARSVTSAEGAIGAIAASHVETQGGFTLLLVARRVSGEMTVLLDWRAAFAALGALLVIGRLLRGRR